MHKYRFHYLNWAVQKYILGQVGNLDVMKKHHPSAVLWFLPNRSRYIIVKIFILKLTRNLHDLGSVLSNNFYGAPNEPPENYYCSPNVRHFTGQWLGLEAGDLVQKLLGFRKSDLTRTLYITLFLIPFRCPKLSKSILTIVDHLSKKLIDGPNYGPNDIRTGPNHGPNQWLWRGPEMHV